MSGPMLTPARLAVLRDIANPHVVVMCQRSPRKSRWRISWRYDPRAPSAQRRKNVSERCDELERFGWIEMDDPGTPISDTPRQWRLTEMGATLVAAAERPA